MSRTADAEDSRRGAGIGGALDLAGIDSIVTSRFDTALHRHPHSVARRAGRHLQPAATFTRAVSAGYLPIAAVSVVVGAQSPASSATRLPLM